VFAGDDWRIHPRFVLSLGLRYEFQTHASDWKDIAPRIGFSWGLGAARAALSQNEVEYWRENAVILYRG
jgi:outer membrane receptor for ferrienterochelin and colicin